VALKSEPAALVTTYAMPISFLPSDTWDPVGNVIAALMPILFGALLILFTARRLVPQPAA